MKFYVGRSAQQCDVIVSDDSVSRVHLQVEAYSSQAITLQDQNSSYGSFYWHEQQQAWLPFQSIDLSVNSYIMIGNAKLRVMELLIAYQVKRRNQRH